MIHKLAALFCSLACMCLPVLGQGVKVLKDSGLQKLKVFLGTWRASSADSSKISAINTCRWSPNGKFLVADQQITNNGVTTNNLSIYNYNAETDNYTLTLVGIKGMGPFTVPITYRGDTLIYEGGSTNRTLNIFESADRYRYVIQSSADGKSWKTVGEGWSGKVKD